MGWDVLNLFSYYLKDAQGLSDSDKQEVYEIVIKAIRSTRTYISQTRKEGKDEPSNILSLIWQNAAIKLKKIGNENLKSFAGDLEGKSKYWSEPHSYTIDQLTEYGMMLTQVENKLKELTK